MTYANEDEFLEFLRAYKAGTVDQVDEPSHSAVMNLANNEERALDVYRGHEMVKAGRIGEFKEFDLEDLVKE